MSKHKLDIFETLRAIDARDLSFLENKTEEERKAFAPIVVMRWASAINDGPNAGKQILQVNEINKNFWELWEYPDLQYKLLASAGLGRTQRHHWIAAKKSKSGHPKITSFINEVYPEYSDFEIDILLNKFNIDSFREFLVSYGLDEKEEKELINEFKSRI